MIKNITKKIESKQEFRNSLLPFDPDSSPLSWKIYGVVYRDTVLHKIFDFEKKHRTYGKYKRMYISNKSNFDDEKLSAVSYNISGDCDFNFSGTKIKLFEKIIDKDKSYSEEKKEELRIKLKCANEMHHTVLNFSLMLMTGGMNNYKGSYSFDRLDKFIYLLNEFYNKSNKKIHSRRNGCKLKTYLNHYKNVHEYCEVHYFMEKSLVDKMIESGAQSIASAQDLEKYIKLANEYWSKKRKIYEDKVSF